LPDQPLEARLDAPPEQQPVEIQIANVERRLRENPNDAMGWTVIAPVYLRLRQFDKAAEAYRRSIVLAGESEEKLLGLMEALTLGNDGVIPDQAKPLLKAVVDHNPSSIRGRFWLALLAEQDGRDADAKQTYSSMISENIPDAWKIMAQQRLNALTKATAAAGKTESEAGGPASPGGAQGDQAAMIRGMVDGLAARLKENGADLEGWLKLIHSYTVLRETAKAQDALASARRQFASNPEALNKIEALVQGLGLQASDSQSVQTKP
jgi:cytochrome c-type biogenesis protein CcmH